MTTAVKRACDACHRRKVKCDGVNPCRNCAAAQLSCTYNAIPQKKGPKGSRAKVISELRETQRQTSLSAKVQGRNGGVVSSQSYPGLAPSEDLLSPGMVKACLEFFFTNMYPTMPILHRPRLEQQAMYMDQSLDTYCLLSSLCAFTLLQPGMVLPIGPGSDPYGPESMLGTNIVTGTTLMDETIRVRRGYDYLESPSLNSLCTSYFLFGSYYALDLHDKAWFHLREATTLAHMIGMNKEETYLSYDNIEASRRRRLYWLLFVTERAYALQRQRPLTLQATINAPSAGDDPSDPLALAHSLNSFLHLVSVFRPFDDTFTALWTKARNETAPTYLAALQKQFDDVLPVYVNVADSSLNDLQLNQQWLKTQTWHLSMATSHANDPSLQLPVDVQNDLLAMASHFSSESMGLLGFRLIEKLFELSCSLSEFLYLQPASRDPFAVGPREHLRQLLNLLTVLRNRDYRFLPLLLTKVHDVLPRLANPMLQDVPENAANIDIFDGFGNAGLAQPPVLSMEQYDSKFSVSRLDDLVNENGSPSVSSQRNASDMNSPFVGSPSVVSPVAEYPHGLPGEFGSIQEMVMTPIGPNPNTAFNSAPSINGTQSRHQPHRSMSGLPILGSQPNSHMPISMTSVPNPPANLTLPSQGSGQGQGLDPGPKQGMNAILGSNVNASLNANSMPSRPGPSRANSFAIPSQQIRTIGDFHALQRANSDMTTMGAMGLQPVPPKLDFNTLR
jgi:hypothetical protein